MKLEDVGAPKLLYLQDSECKWHEDTEGITWCGDPVGDDDTAYIRMDVHNETLRHLSIAVDALKGVRDYPMTPPSMVDLILEALAQIEEKK